MAINEGGRTRSLMYLSVTDLCKGVSLILFHTLLQKCRLRTILCCTYDICI